MKNLHHLGPLHHSAHSPLYSSSTTHMMNLKPHNRSHNNNMDIKETLSYHNKLFIQHVFIKSKYSSINRNLTQIQKILTINDIKSIFGR